MTAARAMKRCNTSPLLDGKMASPTGSSEDAKHSMPKRGLSLRSGGGGRKHNRGLLRSLSKPANTNSDSPDRRTSRCHDVSRESDPLLPLQRKSLTRVPDEAGEMLNADMRRRSSLRCPGGVRDPSQQPDLRRRSSSRGPNNEKLLRERVKGLEITVVDLSKKLANTRAELNFMKKSRRSLALPAQEFTRLRQTNESLQESYKEKLRQVDALSSSIASIMADGKQLYVEFTAVKEENAALRAELEWWREAQGKAENR